jgi:uncharacterized membrane protein
VKIAMICSFMHFWAGLYGAEDGGSWSNITACIFSTLGGAVGATDSHGQAWYADDYKRRLLRDVWSPL